MSESPKDLVDRIADVLDRWDPYTRHAAYMEFDTVSMAFAIIDEVLKDFGLTRESTI